jgi:hypothetical protein
MFSRFSAKCKKIKANIRRDWILYENLLALLALILFLVLLKYGIDSFRHVRLSASSNKVPPDFAFRWSCCT